jgi:AraC-like DNA-binding protein
MIEKLDLWNIFFLFAAGQGIFLSIMMLVKYGTASKNIYIALLVLLFSLNTIENVFYWTNSLQGNPHINNTTRGFVYLLGPLLVFYLNPRAYNVKSRMLHLFAFLIFTVYMIPYYILSAETKVAYLNGELQFTTGIPYFYAITTCLILIIYGFYLIRFKKKHLIEATPAIKMKIQFIHSFLIFIAMWLLYYLLVFTINFKIEYDYMISIVSALMIYQIGYYCFLSPKLLIDPKKKYSKSGLEENDVEQFAKILETMMSVDKLYLENELRIQDLAKRLNVTINHLSQVINQYYQKNFSDFINSYRIGEAKRILEDSGNNDTILAIAYEVGFNNKTTFNITFKRLTGFSPSEYRKQFIH